MSTDWAGTFATFAASFQSGNLSTRPKNCKTIDTGFVRDVIGKRDYTRAARSAHNMQWPFISRPHFVPLQKNSAKRSVRDGVGGGGGVRNVWAEAGGSLESHPGLPAHNNISGKDYNSAAVSTILQFNSDI